MLIDCGRAWIPSFERAILGRTGFAANVHSRAGIGTALTMIDLIRQPDAYTCGPTCVAMIAREADRRARRPSLPIAEVAAMAGTDRDKGTVEAGIGDALRGLGFQAARSVDDRLAAASVFETARRGDFALLRTLSFGIKHWVLAYGVDENDRILVADPAFGYRQLSVGQVDELIRPRSHEWWLVPAGQRGCRIEVAQFDRDSPDFERLQSWAVDATKRAFAPKLRNDDGSWIPRYTHSATDWATSRVLLRDGAPIGCYLLRPTDKAPTDRPGFAGNGVEGVSLVVEPEYRGMGYGRLLRSVPDRLGFDFVFGRQLKELENLESWLNSRELLADRGEYWVTGRRCERPLGIKSASRRDADLGSEEAEMLAYR